MFFVVSTGRAGSQTIARVLSESPDCVCLHEPEPVLIREATLYEYGLITDEMMRALLLSTRPRTVNGKTYGESNLKLSGLIPILAQTFPDARFIWLVRDGRDVVASTYYSKDWYKSIAERATASAEPLPLSEVEWHGFFLRADLLGEMSTAEWEALSRFEKNCWLWNHTNANIQRHLAELPPECSMLVRLETFVKQLPDICRFVGIPAPATIEQEHHNVARRAPLVWEDWPEDQRAAFDKWCEPMMTVLYPQWREPGTHKRRNDPPPLPEKRRRWWRRIGLGPQQTGDQSHSR